MEVPQEQLHVEMLAPTEESHDSSNMIVSYRKTTEQDVIKHVEKLRANSNKADDVHFFLPPQWTKVPVDTEEGVGLTLSRFQFTPTQFSDILREVDMVKAASAGETPDKSTAQWHVTLVAVDPTLVNDYSVGLTQPTPFPGQFNRPTIKILSYDTFAKHACARV